MRLVPGLRLKSERDFRERVESIEAESESSCLGCERWVLYSPLQLRCDGPRELLLDDPWLLSCLLLIRKGTNTFSSVVSHSASVFLALVDMLAFGHQFWLWNVDL